jgi:hypothetical protein
MTTERINPRELVKQFPKRYGYANKISQRLHQKGLFVTQSTIYHVVKGNTYHPEIINALMDELEQYRADQSQIHQRFDTLKNP